MLAFGELDGEFLDEGRHIVVADDLAFEFLDGQGGVGNHDFEVLFHFHLAAQTPMVLNLFAVEESDLGGQNLAAAFHDAAFALSAVAFSAAGGGQVNLLFGQGAQQVAARRHLNLFLAIVDGYFHFAFGGEGTLDYQQQGYQRQDDQHHQDNGSNNRHFHTLSLLYIIRKYP